MTTTARKAPHHNKLTCYTDYGCRRTDCVERYNAYRRERRRAENEGTWQPFVDAAPVREHLRDLEAAGINAHRVAALTGLPYQTVREFLHHAYGNRRARRSRTSAETAQKILAVTADGTLPGFVDATATRRRIQALVARGWPMSRLGEHIGITPKHVYKITTQRYVYHHTARAVEDAYHRLAAKRPDKSGIAKREAAIARRRAAANRWPTPAYWADLGDLIADPDFEPEYGRLQAEIIAEEARWLMTAGRLNRQQAADRLGVSLFTVDRALREHPHTEMEVAA
ncbi:hypothetical protein [Streptomyces sp. NPDC008150]|uniref:hypothetical protein n=1 Tax=Streptomyces sp. NPDC008150 TaxID=3364816 RepID=UPI0036E45241